MEVKQYLNSDLNSRLVYTPFDWMFYSVNNLCWEHVIADGFCWHKYAEGCGLLYTDCSYGVNISMRQLKYFKKGDEEWGEKLKVGLACDYDANYIQVYPNPANIKLNIVLDNDALHTVVLLDLVGNIVFEKEIQGELKSQLSIENVNSGFYFLKIECENRAVYFQKIQKL